MSHVTCRFCLALLLITYLSATRLSGQANLSGTWVLDETRGDEPAMGKHANSVPGAPSQDRITVSLLGPLVTINNDSGKRALSRTYQLAPLASLQAGANEGALASLSASKLTTHRRELVTLPHGAQVRVDTVEVYTPQADGSLLVERTVTTPSGSITHRHTFKRQEVVR